LINLTIAVMLKNYDELDRSEQNTKHQADLIEIGMEAKLPSRLIYFIVKEENLIISKKANKRLTSHDEKLNWKHRIFSSFIYSKVTIPREGYHKYKVTRFFYWLVSLPIYGAIVLFFILCNTIILSLERYPMPESEQDAYYKANIFFTLVFTVEVLLKIIGLSPKAFIMDRFNIFDAVIVLVSISELFISSGSGGVSALRAFRLFRIFKLFRTGNLRVLLDSIAYTMSTIGNYVILLALFIYVYALLGMQFFAGNLKFDHDGYYDSNGEVPRANFDTLYWAAITVFQVLIGDNWNNVMIDCELAVSRFSALYFISLILFGNIVMLNLFLAILLGNFDKARTYWLKKRLFEMFEIAINRDYSLSHALTIILGDVTRSVKKELLVHEPKDIFKLNGRLSIINREVMMNDPEGEDKVHYYDKIVQYQLDYKPIEEFKAEEEKSEKIDSDEDSEVPLSKAYFLF
jgi:hypothetical protein